jgi:hypothetical protein
LLSLAKYVLTYLVNERDRKVMYCILPVAYLETYEEMAYLLLYSDFSIPSPIFHNS